MQLFSETKPKVNDLQKLDYGTKLDQKSIKFN